ncbi:hypothetical protein YC2023_051560 [Brassica napus]
MYLKLKGKPRATIFSLISENWEGLSLLGDLDLDVLAKARLDKLEGLKLDKCSGFSTDGLLSIVKPCSSIGFPALCSLHFSLCKREEEWKSCTNAEEVGQVLDSMWMVEIE